MGLSSSQPKKVLSESEKLDHHNKILSDSIKYPAHCIPSSDPHGWVSVAEYRQLQVLFYNHFHHDTKCPSSRRDIQKMLHQCLRDDCIISQAESIKSHRS